jgi:DNA-directed RNA polymerase subunit E'/Rpb7
MSGEKMFERRELVRVVTVPSKHLQKDIQSSILMYLKSHVEGRCGVEGYVQPKTSVIIDHSLGRLTSMKMGVSYRVKFQADICMPHPGQTFRAVVNLRSKIGLHAELLPMKILLPRDLHLDNAEFEDIKEKQEIEFKVVGSRFQQGDSSIVVLGTLTSVINPAAEKAMAVQEETIEPLIAASTPGDPSEKRVVQVSPELVKAAEPARRRKLTKAPAAQTNEST